MQKRYSPYGTVQQKNAKISYKSLPYDNILSILILCSLLTINKPHLKFVRINTYLIKKKKTHFTNSRTHFFCGDSLKHIGPWTTRRFCIRLDFVLYSGVFGGNVILAFLFFCLSVLDLNVKLQSVIGFNCQSIFNCHRQINTTIMDV